MANRNECFSDFSKQKTAKERVSHMAGWPWKPFLTIFFNKYGGLAFLLKCNFDSAKLDKNLPLFYRELLDYFQELTNNSQYITNDLILWNNKNITVDTKSLFWKSWFDRGIYFIGDLLNSAGNFLPLTNFKKSLILKSVTLITFS